MDIKRENKLLKRELKRLTEEAANNEAILKRSQRRQMKLLETESLRQLLQLLTVGLVDDYGLTTVTLYLCDPEHHIRHLLHGDAVGVSDLPGIRFVDDLQGIAPQFEDFKTPWLGPCGPSDLEVLFPGTPEIRSAALIPLSRQGRPVGSLNFGSTDASRFTRYHAADFLQHLGVIVSFCLENTINRARLVRSGLTDVLTGWHNRRYLQDRLLEELARAQRTGKPLVCLLIDVDHFKQINDTHGHLVGDTVLREAASRIESQVRASDVAARFGGDEFAVLLPATDIDEAGLLGERIRQAVDETPVVVQTGHRVKVTLSIGMAKITPAQNDEDFPSLADTLLRKADAALYAAKSKGRNRVCFGQ